VAVASAGYMQIICTSIQTDNHASTSPFSFFTGRMPVLPPNQQHQSTEGTQYHWQSSVNQEIKLNQEKKNETALF